MIFQPSEYSRANPAPGGRDFDYPVPVEGKMAQNYLWQMEQDAKTLHDKLRPNDTLPGWVNYYIATSADRLQQASRYMQHEMVMQEARSNPDNLESTWEDSGARKVVLVVILGGLLYGMYKLAEKSGAPRDLWDGVPRSS